MLVSALLMAFLEIVCLDKNNFSKPHITGPFDSTYLIPVTEYYSLRKSHLNHMVLIIVDIDIDYHMFFSG